MPTDYDPYIPTHGFPVAQGFHSVGHLGRTAGYVDEPWLWGSYLRQEVGAAGALNRLYHNPDILITGNEPLLTGVGRQISNIAGVIAGNIMGSDPEAFSDMIDEEIREGYQSLLIDYLGYTPVNGDYGGPVPLNMQDAMKDKFLRRMNEQATMEGRRAIQLMAEQELVDREVMSRAAMHELLMVGFASLPFDESFWVDVYATKGALKVKAIQRLARTRKILAAAALGTLGTGVSSGIREAVLYEGQLTRSYDEVIGNIKLETAFGFLLSSSIATLGSGYRAAVKARYGAETIEESLTLAQRNMAENLRDNPSLQRQVHALVDAMQAGEGAIDEARFNRVFDQVMDGTNNERIVELIGLRQGTWGNRLLNKAFMLTPNMRAATSKFKSVRDIIDFYTDTAMAKTGTEGTGSSLERLKVLMDAQASATRLEYDDIINRAVEEGSNFSSHKLRGIDHFLTEADAIKDDFDRAIELLYRRNTGDTTIEIPDIIEIVHPDSNQRINVFDQQEPLNDRAKEMLRQGVEKFTREQKAYDLLAVETGQLGYTDMKEIRHKYLTLHGENFVHRIIDRAAVNENSGLHVNSDEMYDAMEVLTVGLENARPIQQGAVKAVLDGYYDLFQKMEPELTAKIEESQRAIEALNNISKIAKTSEVVPKAKKISLQVRRSAEGDYAYTKAKVGKPDGSGSSFVEFTVDTGASGISVSRSSLKKLGFTPEKIQEMVSSGEARLGQSMIASGETMPIFYFKVPELKVGNLTLRDVEVHSDLDFSQEGSDLLGMQAFKGYTINMDTRNAVLTLTPQKDKYTSEIDAVSREEFSYLMETHKRELKEAEEELESLRPNVQKARNVVQNYMESPDGTLRGSNAEDRRTVLISDKYLHDFLIHSAEAQRMSFYGHTAMRGAAMRRVGSSESNYFMERSKEIEREIEELIEEFDEAQFNPGSPLPSIKEEHEAFYKIAMLAQEADLLSNYSAAIADLRLANIPQDKLEGTMNDLRRLYNDAQAILHDETPRMQDYADAKKKDVATKLEIAVLTDQLRVLSTGKNAKRLSSTLDLIKKKIADAKARKNPAKDMIDEFESDFNDAVGALNTIADKIATFRISDVTKAAGQMGQAARFKNAIPRYYMPGTAFATAYDKHFFETLTPDLAKALGMTADRRLIMMGQEGVFPFSNPGINLRNIQPRTEGKALAQQAIKKLSGVRGKLNDIEVSADRNWRLEANMTREISAEADSKKRKKLEKHMSNIIDDFSIINGRLFGTPANTGVLHEDLGPLLRRWNYTTSMGAVTLSSLPDMAMGVLTAGMAPYVATTFRYAYHALRRRLSDLEPDDRYYMMDYANALEQHGTATRVSQLMYLNRPGDNGIQEFSRTQRDFRERAKNFVESASTQGADKMTKWNQLARWNGFWKAVNNGAAASRLGRVADKLARGKNLSGSDEIFLKMLKLDVADVRDMKVLYDEFGEQGGLRGKYYYARSQKWRGNVGNLSADRVGELKRKFNAALSLNSDMSILTPGAGNLPGWTDDRGSSFVGNTGLGGLISQFKRYWFIATENVMVPLVQRMGSAHKRPDDAIQAMMGATGLLMTGALVSAIKGALRGQNPYPALLDSENASKEQMYDAYKQLMLEAVDRSGVLGIFTEPFLMYNADKLSRADMRGGGDGIGIETILGPTGGKVKDLSKVAKDLYLLIRDGEPMRPTAVRSGRRLVPFQNLLPFTAVADTGFSYYEAHRKAQRMSALHDKSYNAADFYLDQFKYIEHRLAPSFLNVDYSNYRRQKYLVK